MVGGGREERRKGRRDREIKEDGEERKKMERRKGRQWREDNNLLTFCQVGSEERKDHHW